MQPSSSTPRGAKRPPLSSGSSLVMGELFAGVARVSSLMAECGWEVMVLCECVPVLVSLLKHKFPRASVAEDMETKPWVQWAAAGISVLLLFAGTSCQPFSAAGKQEMHADRRAWQPLLVLEAAIALCAQYIILENVPDLVDMDHVHGVFTIIQREFQDAGFELVRLLRPRHDLCGGGTVRDRVLLAFRRSQSSEHSGFDFLSTLNVIDRGPACGARMRDCEWADQRHNWAMYGCVQGPVGSRNPLLQPAASVLLGGMGLAPGVVVKIPGSVLLWRIQRVHVMTLHLMHVDRRSPTVMSVDASVATVVEGPDSTYEVFDVNMLFPAIRAWGEPPGYGCALAMSAAAGSRWIGTLSIAARWTLQEGLDSDRIFLEE
jgi:hypothetical protein